MPAMAATRLARATGLRVLSESRRAATSSHGVMAAFVPMARSRSLRAADSTPAPAAAGAGPAQRRAAQRPGAATTARQKEEDSVAAGAAMARIQHEVG